MRNFLLILLLIGLAAVCLTSCERSMAKPMMDAVTPTDMSTMDDPEAFAMALVQGAVDLYKTEGREVMIAYHNSPASIDGQWYVFITDENNIYLAHPVASEFLGSDITQIPGIDGTLIGAEIAMATEEGRWTEYLWPNPETNKLEQKRTWSIRHDGYLFAAGYYEPWAPDPATLPVVSKDDPAAFTHAVVLAAIARYEFAGLEATATYYNDPANIDGQWYVSITDENDIFVAHAPMPDLVGTDLKDVMGLDGSPLGANIAKTTGIGLWTKYLWPNPETGQDEQKHLWAIQHDGYLFGSGYYAPASKEATAETN
ncbi:MAG: cache domain-containing protein [Candidatus Poribacteria bacterium]|nr:cache domain-containing protein [Candidatus Poribacteria bacterium]